MTHEEVIRAMADSVLQNEGTDYTREQPPYQLTWADETARQWWCNFIRKALRVAQANGWILVRAEDYSAD